MPQRLLADDAKVYTPVFKTETKCFFTPAPETPFQPGSPRWQYTFVPHVQSWDPGPGYPGKQGGHASLKVVGL
jgi:hypothetical protein